MCFDFVLCCFVVVAVVVVFKVAAERSVIKREVTAKQSIAPRHIHQHQHPQKSGRGGGAGVMKIERYKIQ